MSIAFGARCAAFDGNARRVLSRIYAMRDEAALRTLAARLVPATRPGDFNQALMDLGATVCLAHHPRCAVCPLDFTCAAKTSGVRDAKRGVAKPAARRIEWPLAVIEQNGKVLLRRRSESGLLAGLWEIPGGERKARETPRAWLKRELDGLDARMVSAVGIVRHSITDRNIRAPVYRCAVGAAPRAPGWRWFAADAVNRLPLSSLSLKALRLAQKK
jgi:A/G-specific adenine glycosylase